MSYATIFIMKCQQEFFIYLISITYRLILVHSKGNKRILTRRGRIPESAA